MAVRCKTIEYVFPTKNTSLASATRFDFTAITLYIPETSNRTFRSVRVQVFCRDTVTTATSMTSPVVGIKLGAAAFSDVTLSNPPANSGESVSYIFERDVTSYFSTNFGSGASQTCQVGVNFSGVGTINISVKLYITYEADEQQTRVKTVRIPLDSGTGALTNTLAEIGTNQIPALSSFLPESSVTKRQVWIELLYNEGLAGTTQDPQLGMQVDSETEHLAGAVESGLASSCVGIYYWDQTAATWVASGGGSAHAFKLRSTQVTNGASFHHVAIILCITYEYDHTNSTTILNSLILALPVIVQPGSTASGDAVAASIDLWIEEPATITQVQSGLLAIYVQTAATLPSVVVGAGSARQYTDAALAFCGASYLTQRSDSGGAGGSSWTLARGKNTLKYEVFINANNYNPSCFCALLYLNYTSGKDGDGDGVHNHTTIWHVMETSTSSNVPATASAAQWINIPESNWFRNNLAFMSQAIMGTPSLVVHGVDVEAGSGELNGANFENQLCIAANTDGETGIYPLLDIAKDEQWDRWSNDPQTIRMDIEASRRIRVWQWLNGTKPLSIYFTYHGITFTVSGNITNSAGGTVNIDVFNTADDTLIATASRSGNGSYSATVFDSANNHYAVAKEDGTHLGRSDDGAPT